MTTNPSFAVCVAPIPEYVLVPPTRFVLDGVALTVIVTTPPPEEVSTAVLEVADTVVEVVEVVTGVVLVVLVVEEVDETEVDLIELMDESSYARDQKSGGTNEGDDVEEGGALEVLLDVAALDEVELSWVEVSLVDRGVDEAGGGVEDAGTEEDSELLRI